MAPHTLLATLSFALGAYGVAATAVYDCGTWPGGSLAAALIVDCPDNALGGGGPIPDDMWQGQKYLIDIARNGLTGSLDLSYATESLRSISVASNSLGGALPATLPAQLKDADLSDNRFTGELPSTWSTAGNLRSVDLNGNSNITGSIPSSWSNFTKLELLDLRGTGLGGIIPSELSSLTLLRSFLVDGCNFTGCVPINIPFTTPSVQISGHILERCTAAPTTSPSKAPVTSSPTFVPSQTPSHAPTFRPTARPTRPDDTDAPTTADEGRAAGFNAPSPVAIGVGIGVSFAAIVVIGFAAFIYFRQPSGSSGTQKDALAPADAEGATPGPSPPPPPSGPRPGRTFVPGVGWVQDKASAGARFEPAPPPQPKQ